MKFVQVLYASKKNGLYHAKDSILVGITEFEKCLVDIGLYFQNWLCRDNKAGCFCTCFHSIDALHTPFANLLADSWHAKTLGNIGISVNACYSCTFMSEDAFSILKELKKILVSMMTR